MCRLEAQGAKSGLEVLISELKSLGQIDTWDVEQGYKRLRTHP